MIPGVVAQGKSGASALWTPSNLTTPPKIWVDDQSPIIEDDSVVETWGSHAGAVAFSQSVSGNRPIAVSGELNGKRIVRFSGGSKLRCGSTSIGRNVEAIRLFAVYKTVSSSSGYQGVLEIDRPNATFVRAGLMAAPSAGTVRPTLISRRQDNDGLSVVSSPNEAVDRWVMVMGSALYTLRIERVEVDGALGTDEVGWSSAGLSSDTDSIGGAIGGDGSSSNTSHRFSGDIAAIVVIDGAYAAIPQSDVDKLFGWAAWRYDLVDNLPANHPYKLAPPLA